MKDDLDQFPLDVSEWDDTDGDGTGDNDDDDDDGDQLADALESAIGTDPLNPDTDGDGYWDSIDDLPLDSTDWEDTDGDGTGDATDVLPSISRYQTTEGVAFELAISSILVLGVLAFVIRIKSKYDDVPTLLSEYKEENSDGLGGE